MANKCSYPGCDMDGFLSIKGHRRFEYCPAHYKEIAGKIREIRRKFDIVRRRNEATDNQPARIHAEM